MTTDTNNFQDLIPDYLANRLSVEQKEAFEQQLADDQLLGEELEDFKSFKILYQEIEVEDNPAPDHIFQRITAAIDEAESVPQPVKARNNSDVNVFTQFLTDGWEWLRESLTIPWALAAVQAALIVFLVMPSPQDKTYQTLSSNSPAVEQPEQITYNIVFKESATAQQIKELMLSLNGSITSGPTDQGRYLVSFDQSANLSSLVSLVEDSDIVLFFQSNY